MAEVRWPGAGRIISERMTFLYSGTKNQRHEKGVGMFLDPKMVSGVKTQQNVIGLSSRRQ